MADTAASWQRKIEVLKAATNAETTLKEISSMFNLSKGTIWNILKDFTTLYQLTEEESDFPRKLLKMYNINIQDQEGSDRLSDSDVRNLRHYVERAIAILWTCY